MMKTILAIIGIAVLLGCVGIVVVHQRARTGHQTLSVTDVSKPLTASVRAPIGPFRAGTLLVIVEGHLDGEAALTVVSNHGRDLRETALHGPAIAVVVGGTEEWVDDLQVNYRPGTAKSGQLSLSLYCGKNLTPEDRVRFQRISQSK